MSRLGDFFSGLFSSSETSASDSVSSSGSDSSGNTNDVFDSWGTSTGNQTWAESSNSIDRASSFTDTSFGSIGSTDAW
jgi:hypothetical protein